MCVCMCVCVHVCVCEMEAALKQNESFFKGRKIKVDTNEDICVDPYPPVDSKAYQQAKNQHLTKARRGVKVHAGPCVP